MFCCCCCFSLFYFILYFLFLREKSAKVILPFWSWKQVKFLWEELKRKSGLNMAFRVCLERKLESGWLRESKFYISKPQSYLSFYLLYVWSTMILEVYKVENGMCDWCITYHRGRTLVLPEVPNSGMTVWKQRAVYTLGLKRENNWRALLGYPIH